MTLGQPNVDRLLRTLTAQQLLGWEAYARLAPLDYESVKADWRAAQIAKAVFDQTQRLIATIAAVAGAKPHQRPKFVDVALKDFVLQWTQPETTPPVPKKRQQTWQEQWAIIELIQHAYDAGARDEQAGAPTRN